jgi:glycosyltransferase involved in cell wall biosynthesis
LADRISIIVPSRNRVHLLSQALRAARRQTWRDTEIIVVDEASIDGTPAMLARDFSDVQVIRHAEARGPAAARNAGVAAAKGDWVFFWDDDDLMHPDHLAALIGAQHAAPAAALVSGRVRSFIVADGAVRLSPVVCAAEEKSTMETLEEFIQPHRRGTLHLSTILWPAALCRAVPWDETLFINEDVDFCGRALLAGGLGIAGRPVGMLYLRQHHGERASTNRSLQGALAPALYRLKWAELLHGHPERAIVAPATRDGLMAVMIELAGVPEAKDLMPRLDAAFRQWGGTRHYVAPPPRHPLKRLIAQTLLDVGGLKTLKALLAGSARLRRHDEPEFSRFQAPGSAADQEDAGVIAGAR